VKSYVDPRGKEQALYDDYLAEELDFSDEDENEADGSMTIRNAG